MKNTFYLIKNFQSLSVISYKSIIRIYNKYIKFKNLNVKFNTDFHFKNKYILMFSDMQ